MEEGTREHRSHRTLVVVALALLAGVGLWSLVRSERPATAVPSAESSVAAAPEGGGALAEPLVSLERAEVVPSREGATSEARAEAGAPEPESAHAPEGHATLIFELLDADTHEPITEGMLGCWDPRAAPRTNVRFVREGPAEAGDWARPSSDGSCTFRVPDASERARRRTPEPTAGSTRPARGFGSSRSRRVTPLRNRRSRCRSCPPRPWRSRSAERLPRPRSGSRIEGARPCSPAAAARW